jgi:PPOX class probable F420-dependent enzyme
MASGRCRRFAELPSEIQSIVADARRATLGTLDSRGRPHLVPISFALRSGEIVSAIDHKPKTTSSLGRVANLKRDPNVTVLIDRYDEQWIRLGWVMVRGLARMDAPGSATGALAARYPQYRSFPPEGQVIAIAPVAITWWTWSD